MDAPSESAAPGDPAGSPAAARPAAACLVTTGRGIALFWGSLFALDVAGRFLAPGFDAALWWVDFRGWPAAPAYGWLGVVSLLLGAFALAPAASAPRRHATLVALVSVVVAMVSDGLRFLTLWRTGAIQSGFPLPMSFLAAASLAMVILAVVSSRGPPHPAASLPGRRGTVLLMSATVLGLAILFPVAQMFCFGLTDYSRPADIAVVFGARAYADGNLSNALEHRVNTACALYRRRVVTRLLFSGGPGDGAVHETEAMRRAAIRLGVAPQDILVDPMGTSTHATVLNTVPMIRALGCRRVLAVSHFYHLPRVKMCFQAAGLEVATVPAHQERPLRQMPWLIAREVIALWGYYVRAAILAPQDAPASE